MIYVNIPPCSAEEDWIGVGKRLVFVHRIFFRSGKVFLISSSVCRRSRKARQVSSPLSMILSKSSLISPSSSTFMLLRLLYSRLVNSPFSSTMLRISLWSARKIVWMTVLLHLTVSLAAMLNLTQRNRKTKEEDLGEAWKEYWKYVLKYKRSYIAEIYSVTTKNTGMKIILVIIYISKSAKYSSERLHSYFLTVDVWCNSKHSIKGVSVFLALVRDKTALLATKMQMRDLNINGALCRFREENQTQNSNSHEMCP